MLAVARGAILSAGLITACEEELEEITLDASEDELTTDELDTNELLTDEPITDELGTDELETSELDDIATEEREEDAGAEASTDDADKLDCADTTEDAAEEMLVDTLDCSTCDDAEDDGVADATEDTDESDEGCGSTELLALLGTTTGKLCELDSLTALAILDSLVALLDTELTAAEDSLANSLDEACEAGALCDASASEDCSPDAGDELELPATAVSLPLPPPPPQADSANAKLIAPVNPSVFLAK